MKRFAVLGAGRMGGALVQGFLSAGVAKPVAVCVFDPDVSALKRARAWKVGVADNATRAVAGADVVFVCVKPPYVVPLLKDVAGSLKKGAVIVSVAAGVPLARMQKAAGPGARIVRVMPNTPALVRKGMLAFSPGRGVTPGQERWIKTALGALGSAARVPESSMDAVTAVSGSGPAYVFAFTEALAGAARAAGLPAKTAEELARQTVIGAGRLLEASEEDPGELRRQVTSPGGTTEAGLRVLAERSWAEILTGAVKAAKARSKELSLS